MLHSIFYIIILDRFAREKKTSTIQATSLFSQVIWESKSHFILLKCSNGYNNTDHTRCWWVRTSCPCYMQNVFSLVDDPRAHLNGRAALSGDSLNVFVNSNERVKPMSYSTICVYFYMNALFLSSTMPQTWPTTLYDKFNLDWPYAKGAPPLVILAILGFTALLHEWAKTTQKEKHYENYVKFNILWMLCDGTDEVRRNVLWAKNE